MKQLFFLLLCVGFLFAESSIGKTHFIVGETYTPLSQPPVKEQIKNRATSNTVEAFFSPDDSIASQLLQLIDGETIRIAIAIFLLTDKEIAHALVKAKKRGVPIEIITDAGCLKERTSKIGLLCDHGCTVYIYNHKDNTSLMHNKFAIFDAQKKVWTGSYNFTAAAGKQNQENVIVVQDAHTCEKFNKQFDKLKTRSYRYGGHRS